MFNENKDRRGAILEQLLQLTQEGFWFIDSDTVTLDLNPAMCEILGRTREEIIGRSIFDFVDERNAEIFHRQIAARTQGKRGSYGISLRRPDGTSVPCINNASPVVDENGQKVGSIGLWTNISEIKQAEEALQEAHDQLESRVRERTAELNETNSSLRQSEEDFRQLAEGSIQGILIADADRNPKFCNDEFARIFGYGSKEAILALSTTDVLVAPYETDRFNIVLKTTQRPIRYEFDGVQRDGSTINLESLTGTVNWRGQIANYITLYDVTDRRRAERQLRQAQRMEAIGQLTGGVAHDFNNLLAVIQGNAELLADDVGRDNPLTQDILHAAARGSELTRRLLAFSRQQPLRPEPIDLGELVTGMTGLLARTLGETIEIQTVADLNLWRALADRGQLEHALLNLAINARDAMPEGGKLTLEYGNARLGKDHLDENPEGIPGDFVMLAVSDTGCGMSPEDRERAFEPFFTTKEVGKGSGLGLSMVYGLARQSGGHVTLQSEENCGTTVKLYLPRTEKDVQHAKVDSKQAVPRGRNEMVLVLEDDRDVRTLTLRMLKGLNYRVTAVSDARAAHEVLTSGDSPVDLVLSDVVLPGGTSGLEFAERARSTQPILKIVFMSGYPASSVKLNGFLTSGHVLLDKPFQRLQLAKALRHALDGCAPHKPAPRSGP